MEYTFYICDIDWTELRRPVHILLKYVLNKALTEWPLEEVKY